MPRSKEESALIAKKKREANRSLGSSVVNRENRKKAEQVRVKADKVKAIEKTLNDYAKEQEQKREEELKTDKRGDQRYVKVVHERRSEANQSQKAAVARGRDIYPLPNLLSTFKYNDGEPGHLEDGLPPGFKQPINWERRLACKNNLKLFNETYISQVFSKPWSVDQMTCCGRLQAVMTTGGMFALAMPRAGGKTALCRGAITWASAYAHRRFMYFVGSTQDKSQQTLEFIKMYWFRNPLLQQDFPEIAWPVYKLEGRFHLASGQTYGGMTTSVDWGSQTIKFPSLLLSREDAEEYLTHDPDSIYHLPESLGHGPDAYLPIQSGILISTAGVDGSIRGEADVHPITLEQPRPDLVLLDDVQKDQKADSPTSCEKLIRLIDGAVSGLAGPGEHIAALMPCTVIREGDVSDTYLDHALKPDWNGERCRLVISWPDGITDFEISQETPAGKLWNEYAQLRKVSLLAHKDIRLAQALYSLPENRAVMDEGFIVSWPERYSKKSGELSAQQHAMELRFKSPATFCAEYQNIGRKLIEEGEISITADQLMKKTVDYKWREIPMDADILVAFIDIQNEGLFWQFLACDYDYNGIFPAWGVWPKIDANYITHTDLDSWSMMTNAFFKEYPHLRKDAARTTRGYIRAPFEAKIYWGLSKLVPELLSMEFTRKGGRKQTVSKIAIDTRYGKASEPAKRYIRESGFMKNNRVVVYNGQAFPPTNRQLEEYENREGWLFEHQRHPNVKDSAWVIRPNPADQSFYLQADVSRLKDRLFARLASPLGSPGCISLPALPAEKLEMLCNHICSSEYPEPVSARGTLKNIWTERENSAWDNDYLDCSAGLMALASVEGASLKTTEEPFRPTHRRLSDLYRRKQAS